MQLSWYIWNKKAGEWPFHFSFLRGKRGSHGAWEDGTQNSHTKSESKHPLRQIQNRSVAICGNFTKQTYKTGQRIQNVRSSIKGRKQLNTSRRPALPSGSLFFLEKVLQSFKYQTYLHHHQRISLAALICIGACKWIWPHMPKECEILTDSIRVPRAVLRTAAQPERCLWSANFQWQRRLR